jgi:hypothetical protein
LSIAGTRGDVLLTLDHVGKSVAPQHFARMMHALLLCLACLACDMHMVCCLAPMRWQLAVQRKRKWRGQMKLPTLPPTAQAGRMFGTFAGLFLSYARQASA